MGFFSKMKEKFSGSSPNVEEAGEEYVQVDSENAAEGKQKILVRPFVIEDFDQVKPIVDALRDGNTIVLINIKPLRDKDIIELKRAISKIKKTCDAIEGDIAGFGEDWIAATPSFGRIFRGPKKAEDAEEVHNNEEAQVTEYGTGGEELR